MELWPGEAVSGLWLTTFNRWQQYSEVIDNHHDHKNRCAHPRFSRDLIVPMRYFLQGHLPREIPVSPPGSPRTRDEEEEEAIQIAHFLPYIIIYAVPVDEIKSNWKPKKTFQRIIKNKSTGKQIRRKGIMKQPGGSSCNQRR